MSDAGSGTIPAGKPIYPVPPSTATVGMILFLLALGMLFAAAMLAYIVTRLAAPGDSAARSIHVPPLLWISTLLIIASSVTMSRSLAAVRAQRISSLKRSLLFTLSLAISFIAIQTPALVEFLSRHSRLYSGRVPVYGMLFVLVLLHAAHVIGGIAALAVVLRNARRGRYDHEHHSPVRNVVWYWHFLDVVWLLMFVTMLLLR
jgi:heme/copper-type cytochrome/quinol oxidase subunit 3